ncbi:efflux RND transporter periplasmic adaptor subunit [Solimonas terrae]|uniref:Efflux RND transporter periplasmic adaptor subunit n=1 Tax=Solimonas terrae TaxID=1396819 RepID=A0A6M2BPY3_9GAMM|nr:efflux RND transporter periplasmic adaptor subunit [Solimonas terrae]NGY04143.1 efflux RND transporter periplasmic adaptor subunit [Solimonas terrae]
MSPTKPPATTARPVPRSLRTSGIVIAVVLVAIVAIGLTQRARSSSQLRDWTDANALPVVATVQPQALGESDALQLPGRLEAYASAPIYARTSGYLKDWKVDIGAHVKAGQLLAEIETPDVDQQLAQARADFAKAKADADLARSTATRWQAMLGSDAVSKQEVDEKVGDAAAKQAAEAAARANVDRLAATQGFQRIVAPFDGVVTSRSTDVGALISAGGGSGPELFTVADTHKLRVYVQVPQSYIASIRIGQTATMTVPEYPGREFSAKIESTAQAISAASGGTLVQLAVDNTDGDLLPGGYADVSLALPGDAKGASVPASCLIFDGSGMHVALLGADNKVKMTPVDITRDLGKTVEVAGLQSSNRIIDSPPDSLRDGDAVRLADKPAVAPNAAPGKSDANRKA